METKAVLERRVSRLRPTTPSRKAALSSVKPLVFAAGGIGALPQTNSLSVALAVRGPTAVASNPITKSGRTDRAARPKLEGDPAQAGSSPTSIPSETAINPAGFGFHVYSEYPGKSG